MMKKIAAIAVAGLMVISLAGCGDSKDTTSSAATTVSSVAAPAESAAASVTSEAPAASEAASVTSEAPAVSEAVSVASEAPAASEAVSVASEAPVVEEAPAVESTVEESVVEEAPVVESTVEETVVEVESTVEETVVEVESTVEETVVEVESTVEETVVEVESTVEETVVEVESTVEETVVEVVSVVEEAPAVVESVVEEAVVEEDLAALESVVEEVLGELGITVEVDEAESVVEEALGEEDLAALESVVEDVLSELGITVEVGEAESVLEEAFEAVEGVAEEEAAVVESAVEEAVVEVAAIIGEAAAAEAEAEAAPVYEYVEWTPVEEGALHMATNAAFPPYEMISDDGGFEGIDVEICAAIAGKLGVELVVDDMDFSSTIAAVTSGKQDIVAAGMTVTEERLKNISFSNTYATGVQVIIVPEGSAITSVDDLGADEKILIGCQEGTTGYIYASDDYGEDRITAYTNGAMAVQALLSGKVDCVIIDKEPAKAYVEANTGLMILDTEYVVEDYAIGIAKENTALLQNVNTALYELGEEGVLQAIIDKYIGVSEEAEEEVVESVAEEAAPAETINVEPVESAVEEIAAE